MTPQVKKRVIVIGSLLVISGIVGYILYRRAKGKKEEELAAAQAVADAEALANAPKTEEAPKTETQYTPPIGGGGIVNTVKDLFVSPPVPPYVPPALPPQVPIGKGKKVVAVDLLANNIKGANGKSIYSAYPNLPIYNLNNVKVGVTTKGALLGRVYWVSPTVNSYNKEKGFKIAYNGAGNVKYYVNAGVVGASGRGYLIEV